MSGAFRAAGAASVDVSGSTFDGPLEVTGATDDVTIAGNEIGGPVRLINNSTHTAAVVTGNTVAGVLQCADNEPPPTNAGEPNDASSAHRQCADL